MKTDEVPQDLSLTYPGHHRLVYAVDDKGEYLGVHSAGWDVESAATLAAIAEVERLRDDAWRRAKQGIASPLEFHMYNRRMDLPLLAGAAAMWQWRVRRHFDAKKFRKLSAKILVRYADALQISIVELCTVPDTLPASSIAASPAPDLTSPSSAPVSES
ncbi:MAG: hypothetical protein QM709_05925 [Spongiibacteraceae bacterium]